MDLAPASGVSVRYRADTEGQTVRTFSPDLAHTTVKLGGQVEREQERERGEIKQAAKDMRKWRK